MKRATTNYRKSRAKFKRTAKRTSRLNGIRVNRGGIRL